MRKLIVVMPIIFLVSCAHNAETYTIKNFNGIVALTPYEVLQGSKGCILNKMKPRTEFIYLQTQYGKVSVPISVYCDPY
jgi:hypothetical protein